VVFRAFFIKTALSLETAYLLRRLDVRSAVPRNAASDAESSGLPHRHKTGHPEWDAPAPTYGRATDGTAPFWALAEHGFQCRRLSEPANPSPLVCHSRDPPSDAGGSASPRSGADQPCPPLAQAYPKLLPHKSFSLSALQTAATGDAAHGGLGQKRSTQMCRGPTGAPAVPAERRPAPVSKGNPPNAHRVPEPTTSRTACSQPKARDLHESHQEGNLVGYTQQLS